jgi:hypothetical protein
VKNENSSVIHYGSWFRTLCLGLRGADLWFVGKSTGDI